MNSKATRLRGMTDRYVVQTIVSKEVEVDLCALSVIKSNINHPRKCIIIRQMLDIDFPSAKQIVEDQLKQMNTEETVEELKRFRQEFEQTPVDPPEFFRHGYGPEKDKPVVNVPSDEVQ